MIASDLQVSLPTVNRRTSVVVAARLVARAGYADLVLADDTGRPAALVSAPAVTRLLLRETHADTDATIGDLLEDERNSMEPIVAIEPTTSLEETARQMVAADAGVAVVDPDPRAPRFVLLDVVLDALLATRNDPE